MFKTTIVLAGWLVFVCLADTECAAENECRDETQEAARSTVLLARRKRTSATFTELPGDAKHCNAEIVKAACYDFTGDSNMTAFSPALLADAFETDVSSSEGLLALIGLNQSAVTCIQFCQALLEAIPVQARPPAPRVGPRVTPDGTVWDEDLSDALLEEIQIPEEDPEDPIPETKDKVSLLQQKSDEAQDTTQATVLPLPTMDFFILAAEVFEIYPLLDGTWGSDASEAALAEQTGIDCDDDSIYGNGAGYIGCQAETVTGTPCVAWSKAPKHRQLPSNYCRNPSGHYRLWCYTSSAGAWESCEPKGAPDGFTQGLANAMLLGRTWMSKSLKKFNAFHLPKAYEKWLGPSETRRQGLTKEGCTCKKSWSYGGQSVTDYCSDIESPGAEWCIVTNEATGKKCQGRSWGYCAKSTDMLYTTKKCACKKTWKYEGAEVQDYCGNPDNDEGGSWCIVQDPKCQGENWGHCRSLCGPECQRVRANLLRVETLLPHTTFKFDPDCPDAYGYVGARFEPVKTVNVLGANLITHGKAGKTTVALQKNLGSTTVRGRKLVTFGVPWWDMIKECSSDLLKCSPYGAGTAVGTVIHETMHHTDFYDYLYYRNVVKKFTVMNRKSKKAMSVVRACADCIEYFLADNNGFTNTGR